MAVLKFFPKELWSTLDPTSSTQNGDKNDAIGKVLQLSKLKRSDRLQDLDGGELSGNEEGEALERDEDAEASAEDILDDEYEEDEDEGGDYNAEQYFDDGGDDAGDDYDGGEAEGGEFY